MLAVPTRQLGIIVVGCLYWLKQRLSKAWTTDELKTRKERSYMLPTRFLVYEAPLYLWAYQSQGCCRSISLVKKHGTSYCTSVGATGLRRDAGQSNLKQYCDCALPELS